MSRERDRHIAIDLRAAPHDRALAVERLDADPDAIDLLRALASRDDSEQVRAAAVAVLVGYWGEIRWIPEGAELLVVLAASKEAYSVYAFTYLISSLYIYARRHHDKRYVSILREASLRVANNKDAERAVRFAAFQLVDPSVDRETVDSDWESKLRVFRL